MPKRLLRCLSALALAFAVAGPLAAFEIHSIQVVPAAPTSDDPVVVTVTGVSETDCFSFHGVQQYQQNVDFVFSGCPILPRPTETPFTFSGEVGPLPAGTYHARVINDELVIEAVTFTVLPASGPCTPGATALCLNGRRFRVEAEWTANGEQGDGQAIGLSGETGAFSFFQPDNVEVVVKVIAGCALNGRFWVFATGLTNVRTVLTVTDTATGASKTYRNPAGTPFAPVLDTAAFPCTALNAAALTAHTAHDDIELRVNPAEPYDTESVTLYFDVTLDTPCYTSQGLHQSGNSFELRIVSCPFFAPPASGPVVLGAEVGSLPPGTYQMLVLFDDAEIAAHTFTVRDALGTCFPEADVLCLGDRRFEVQADWRANGQEGPGQAADITRDTGRFSFFQPGNVELVVKVLDACALNGHFWVFAGGLTDVRTTLAVTDTATGATRTYENPAGTPFAPVQDSAAFPCP